jgi:hypothetical protein
MTDAPPVPRWSRARWLSLLALAFGAQLGIILWLGERDAVRTRPVAVAPTLSLGPANAGSAELLALLDPTLFALPHRQGFSGEAWLRAPPQPYRPFAWSEPPRWLPLPLEQLGATFNRFTATNQLGDSQGPTPPEPQLLLPESVEPAVFPTHSTLRLAGGLARRRLLKPLELPSWPDTDILTNSVVQLVVDAEGQPVFATLLRPGSGCVEADQHALRQARAARFQAAANSAAEPATNPLLGLTWGELIFQWHTLPMPQTNAVPPGP